MFFLGKRLDRRVVVEVEVELEVEVEVEVNFFDFLYPSSQKLLVIVFERVDKPQARMKFHGMKFYSKFEIFHDIS